MNLAWTRDPITLLLTLLTAYRLTRLWISDTLPPLPRLRRFLYQKLENRWARLTNEGGSDDRSWSDKYYPYGKEINSITGPLSYLLDCYWCSGFWISLATVAAASFTHPTIWMVFTLPFAFSAVIGLIGSRH